MSTLHPRAVEGGLKPEAVAWIERARARHQAWQEGTAPDKETFPAEFHVLLAPTAVL